MREKITFVVKNNVWVCILILKHKNPKRNVSRGEYLIIVKKVKATMLYTTCIASRFFLIGLHTTQFRGIMFDEKFQRKWPYFMYYIAFFFSFIWFLVDLKNF